MPASPTSHEETLAARSAEILSMVEEYATKDAEKQKSQASQSAAVSNAKTEQLLAGILEQLRSMRKTEMFTAEFSLLRLVAGVLQVFVPFCLLVAVWFLMGTSRQDNNAFLALGFGVVLQMMAMTFYMMHGRR